MRRTGNNRLDIGMSPDWGGITEAAARHFKGEPNTRLSSRGELRWGSRGSFKLTVQGKDAGTWYDWEAGEGGRGVVRLVEYLLGTDRDGALQWLRQRGYLSGQMTDLPRAPSVTPAKAKNSPTEDRAAMARSIWSDGDFIPKEPTHPVRRWLGDRNLWREELPVPPVLRWIQGKGSHTGAGSIVALIAPPDAWASAWPSVPEPTGVQTISLDEYGHSALDRPAERGGLSKRTIGVANASVCLVGNPVINEASTPVRVAEGLADALAIAARYEGPVVAMIGTSGMRNPDLAGWLATAAAGVIIHADADESNEGRAPAGTKAGGVLRQSIADRGGVASAIYPPCGYKDAADAARDVGFSRLNEDWADYARTLAETTDWPRWEIARIAQIATSGA